MTDRYESRATTHADVCWSWGPGHYKCAVAEIERLREELSKMRAEVERLSSYYKNGIDCFATPCEEHSGERAPPFDEFFEKYGGLCLICVVDNNEALQAENERLREQLRLAVIDQAIAEAEANDVRRNSGQPAAPDVEVMVDALRKEIERLLDSREREGDRLDWLLARLPGDVIRDLVGEMNCTSDVAEWRHRIDKAARFNPPNPRINPRPGKFGG